MISLQCNPWWDLCTKLFCFCSNRLKMRPFDLLSLILFGKNVLFHSCWEQRETPLHSKLSTDIKMINRTGSNEYSTNIADMWQTCKSVKLNLSCFVRQKLCEMYCRIVTIQGQRLKNSNLARIVHSFVIIRTCYEKHKRSLNTSDKCVLSDTIQSSNFPEWNEYCLGTEPTQIVQRE